MPDVTTAFGAVLDDPARGAALLRARATAAGLPSGPAEHSDLVAAVLGAHTWMVALAVPSLAVVPTKAAAAALAAIYCRANGQAAPDERPLAAQAAALTQSLVDAGPLPTDALNTLGPLLEWVHEHGQHPVAVIAASADLSAGAEHPALAAAANALLALVDPGTLTAVA